MGSIGKINAEVREKIEGSLLNAVREVLPDARIEALCAAELEGTRKRVLPPIAMIWYWVGTGLDRDRSLDACWLTLWPGVAAAFPQVAKYNPRQTGVLARARLRVQLGALEKLNGEVVRIAEEEGKAQGRWHGLRVSVLDGSTSSLEDRPQLEQAFGKPRNQHGPGPHPTLRCVNLVRAGSWIILASAWDHHSVSEQALALRVLEALGPGELALGDRNFSGWQMMAELSVRRADFVLRKETHLDIRNYPHRRLGPNEWLVELPKPERLRKTHAHLPDTLLVRVIKRRMGHGKGRFDLWLVTSLLDAVQYPAEEIVALYGARWGVEEHFDVLKTDLHLDVLRSTTKGGVDKEMMARQIAYNLVRLMMLRAAQAEGVDLGRISFLNAVRVIWAMSACMRYAPPRELPGMYRVMLAMIAANLNPQRPGRHEPRAVRRGRKAFPMLKETRTAWRKREWGVA